MYVVNGLIYWRGDDRYYVFLDILVMFLIICASFGMRHAIKMFAQAASVARHSK